MFKEGEKNIICFNVDIDANMILLGFFFSYVLLIRQERRVVASLLLRTVYVEGECC